MSQTEHPSATQTEALKALSEEDREWLTKRLVEYRSLLEYLHSH